MAESSFAGACQAGFLISDYLEISGLSIIRGLRKQTIFFLHFHEKC